MSVSFMYRVLCPPVLAVLAVWLTTHHCRPKETPEKNKLILSWVPFFGHPAFYFGKGQPSDFKQAGCTYSDCEMVFDPHRVPLEQFDALLFHGFEYYEVLFGTPRVRTPRQLYVYLCFESALRSPIPDRRSDFYNMTITYRLDSDAPWPYFHMLDLVTGRAVSPSLNPDWAKLEPPKKGSVVAEDIQKLVKSKQRMAAWFVSNCHSVSGREEYVQRLQELGVEVDIYGACGTLSCPLDKQDECTHKIGSYWFYLAFENSLCEDYVTEKTVTALVGGAVPVILSGANLTRFLPPGSYLDAHKLGPEALAAEIFRLVAHRDNYARMLWWRSRYAVKRRGPYEWPKDEHPFCSLCAALHKGTHVEHRNPTVRDWWHYSTGGRGTCENLNVLDIRDFLS